METIRFRDEELVVIKEQYSDGNTALSIYTSEGEPYMTATVNVPRLDLDENKVVIKDYSENEGIEKVLRQQGIIGGAFGTVDSGFVSMAIVEVLI